MVLNFYLDIMFITFNLGIMLGFANEIGPQDEPSLEITLDL